MWKNDDNLPFLVTAGSCVVAMKEHGLVTYCKFLLSILDNLFVIQLIGVKNGGIPSSRSKV